MARFLFVPNLIFICLSLKAWICDSTKSVPIRINDFKTLVEGDYLVVDKSEFVKEVMQSRVLVYFVTRPRGFGKSTNLSLLRYFLDQNMNSTKMFKEMAITGYPEFCTIHQNKHPVIFVSFENCARDTFDETYNELKITFSNLYKNHEYVLGSLDTWEKKAFQAVIDKSACKIDLELALDRLTRYIKKKSGKDTIVLIDDYDAPLMRAYSKNFYEELTPFIKKMLLGVLQDNSFLGKAVITGISLPHLTTRESNTLAVPDSVLTPEFPHYFGFTESEVGQMIQQSNHVIDHDKFKDEYYGYQFNDVKMYNPYSVVQAIARGKIERYWSQTSADALIKKLISKAGVCEKVGFDLLFENNSVQKALAKDLVYDEAIFSDEKAFWTLLAHSGYLNPVYSHRDDFREIYNLTIPNSEVALSLKQNVVSGFDALKVDFRYQECLHSLVACDMNTFFKHLSVFIRESGSYHRWWNYRSFVGGIISYLQNDYDIESHRETTSMFPRDSLRPGILFEFATPWYEANLEKAAHTALDKLFIEKRAAVFFRRNLKTVMAIGMAFSERKMGMTYTKISAGQNIRLPTNVTYLQAA